MCQPQKILKRNFSVPPIPQRSDGPGIDSSALKKSSSKKTEHLENGLNENAMVSASSNPCLNNASFTTKNYHMGKTSKQHTGVKSKVGGEKLLTKDANNDVVIDILKVNELPRRKSYESLDVVDGKTMTPVNRTARQKLLKVNDLNISCKGLYRYYNYTYIHNTK